MFSLRYACDNMGLCVGSRRDADAPYPKSGLTFNLHLSSNTIPLLFNFLAIISREDEVQECFYSAGSFAFSIHVLITPYRIFAVVSIVKSRLYAVDSNCCNVFVIYEVGQSNITDSAFVILYALQQSAGIISFQRFVGCFFSTAQSELLEESAGTAGSRTGNQNDRFIRTANLFPVSYLSSEDVSQLSLGQAFYFSCQVFC